MIKNLQFYFRLLTVTCALFYNVKKNKKRHTASVEYEIVGLYYWRRVL